MNITAKIIKIIVISLILASCQSAKDALTLKKKESSDEFLVEKKSPLVLPPDYGVLPLPDSTNENKKKVNDNSLKDLLIKNEKNNKDLSINDNSTQTTSIEKLILEKIK
tara:strand:+ start:70 stop:396 length:327 start_codon:yes stop_codon:yes gene_type:complete